MLIPNDGAVIQVRQGQNNQQRAENNQPFDWRDYILRNIITVEAIAFLILLDIYLICFCYVDQTLYQPTINKYQIAIKCCKKLYIANYTQDSLFQVPNIQHTNLSYELSDICPIIGNGSLAECQTLNIADWCDISGDLKFINYFYYFMLLLSYAIFTIIMANLINDFKLRKCLATYVDICVRWLALNSKICFENLDFMFF